MRLRNLALPVCLFAPFSAAHAQHPLVLNRLNEWNEAAPAPDKSTLEAAIRKKATEIYATKAECAGSAATITKIEPAIADRYAFNALSRRAIRNAWFVTTQMSGCDKAPVRYMVIQRTDNGLNAIRVNRGLSYAWDSLLGDTVPSASLAAIAALKRRGFDCDTGSASSLGVVRIASEEPGLGVDTFGIRYKGGWSEIWPITICKRTAEVLVRFTADGDGGAFTHIPGDKIQILP